MSPMMGGWREHYPHKEKYWDHRGTDQGKVQQNRHMLYPRSTEVAHLCTEKLIIK